ncbi:MAG: hypothetical protein HYZ50_22415 [Deltaproteobacteria bacterium]|nr:hypothetical protein [Deltaproteobacteria bacterium]
MKFSDLVEQVSELLQRQQRISYRALKCEFDLDDEDVEDLKAELIDAKSSEFQVLPNPQHLPPNTHRESAAN